MLLQIVIQETKQAHRISPQFCTTPFATSDPTESSTMFSTLSCSGLCREDLTACSWTRISRIFNLLGSWMEDLSKFREIRPHFFVIPTKSENRKAKTHHRIMHHQSSPIVNSIEVTASNTIIFLHTQQYSKWQFLRFHWRWLFRLSCKFSRILFHDCRTVPVSHSRLNVRCK